MKYLLDTHTLIWFIEGSEKLPNKLRAIIEDPENNIYISIVSLWEISIKQSLNKIELDSSIEEYINKVIENNIEIVSILYEHILKLNILPFHHRDPFDRMLIAQAIVDKMIIISKDSHFPEYETAVLW